MPFGVIALPKKNKSLWNNAIRYTTAGFFFPSGWYPRHRGRKLIPVDLSPRQMLEMSRVLSPLGNFPCRSYLLRIVTNYSKSHLMPHISSFFSEIIYTCRCIAPPSFPNNVPYTVSLIDHTVVHSKKGGKLKRTMEIKEQEDWRFDSSNVIRSFWRSAMEWSGIARFLCCCAYKKSL